ncbi:hypothetical protein [Gaopeijia maritima]|uniref:Uncharacterized protein n=1 Tax=Gaopeijia maritima TaxID=3119007 RepID=A0ABU9E8W8_9BACT
MVQLWGVFDDIYCPHEHTFDFLEQVFDQVMALFPSLGSTSAATKRRRRSGSAARWRRR